MLGDQAAVAAVEHAREKVGAYALWLLSQGLGGADPGSLFATTLSGQIAFGPTQLINGVTDSPRSLQAADLDGDGDLDVFAVVEQAAEVIWFANLCGQGNFGDAQLVSAALSQPVAVSAADVDGDGDLDLLSCSEGDRKLAWYANLDGAGSFGAQQIIAIVPGRPVAMCVIDVDGDGDPDVLCASEGDDTVAWYANLDGLGTFGSQQLITDTATHATDVFAEDLDGDGDPDVLSAAWIGDEFAWHENLDGFGNFGPAGQLGPPAQATSALWAADLDSDADLDVLLAHHTQDKVVWHANLLRSWVDLNHQLAGTSGAPHLTGAGPLVADLPVTLTLQNALPFSSSALVLGFQRLDLLGFKGGVLVPAPDLVFLGLPIDGAGGLQLEERWPPGVLPDTSVYIQHWVVDAGGPQGFAASNALAGTTPP